MIYSKEYLGLQIDLAGRAAEITDHALIEAIRTYTAISRSLKLKHKEANPTNEVWREYARRLDGGNPKEETYNYYKSRTKTVFDSEKRWTFGSFQCTAPDEEGLIHIHFSDQDGPGDGPLNRSRVSERIKELTVMFGHIKESFPEARMIGGFSWLYNIEAYRRLFPEEYVNNQAVKQWWRSLALWGQFLQRNGCLRHPGSDDFRDRIMEETTMDGLWEAFPHKPLEVRCPIEVFYDFYGIK